MRHEPEWKAQARYREQMEIERFNEWRESSYERAQAYVEQHPTVTCPKCGLELRVYATTLAPGAISAGMLANFGDAVCYEQTAEDALAGCGYEWEIRVPKSWKPQPF